MKSITPPAETTFTRITVPLITTLIVALWGLLYWQTGQLRHHQTWVSHSYRVRLEIEELDRHLRETESMQRAILLSGNRAPELQIDFSSLIGSVHEHVGTLLSLVRDSRGQTSLVEEVVPLVYARLATLERNSRELAGMDEAARSERIIAGMEDTRRIGEGLEKIRKSEILILEDRAEAAAEAGKRLLMLAAGGSAMGIGVMAVSMVQERKNRILREQYQNRLADARDSALDAVKATSGFVASVSHEIRTPMNGVLGAADLLRQDPNLGKRQVELVDTIRTSGEALLELVNDILDLSKLQAGRMDFAREDFSLPELLDECLALFSDAAGRKHLELAHRVDPDLPKRFSSDPRWIRQVLTNVIGNAVKFTEKGSVAIEVLLRHRGDDGRTVMVFRVSDTGPGISPEEQKNLFQPFGRTDVRLNRKHSGTGLGLAISQEIVERLGGKMGVESAPQQGSTFWFTVTLDPAKAPENSGEPLPLPAEKDPKPTSMDAPGKTAPPLPEARILLVEDNPINQRIFSRQMELLGLQISIQCDGHEGVEARKSGGFDLVLMDCQLPTMDGFEATRLIREWESATGAGRIPIIAITAHVTTGDAEACYQAGMDDFLPKPFDLAKLKAKLGRWLDSSARRNSTPLPQPPPILDDTRLSGCMIGDPDEDQKLLSDALAEIQERILIMKQAIGARNDDQWRAAAHRALGTSGLLGFEQLAAVFRTAEQDDGDWETRKRTEVELSDALVRIRALLVSHNQLPP